jgi:signal peptidase I
MVRSALKISAWTAFLMIMILISTILFYFFQARGNIDKVPSFFGYKALTVLSNSMHPSFNAGD